MDRPFQNIWGNPTIGETTRVGAFVEIGSTEEWPTVIGEGCSIQAFCYICPGTILEDDVFLGPRVTMTNDKYPPSNRKSWSGVTVKKGASIGAGSILLPGVTIGENAVVGAGSVVTKDVAANTTVAGNPARLLK